MTRPTRVLILGAGGMLGHKLFHALRAVGDVFGTLRANSVPPWGVRDGDDANPRGRIIVGVDANAHDAVVGAIDRVRADVVINCIGLVKQREVAKHAVPAITINSLFPHQLADACSGRGVRLVHLSTDCVFSGGKGGYREDDVPDPVDLYGRSKLLGEVDREGCLTLRTSIIGWELAHRSGLLEWFAAQRGKTIRGYQRAIYSGVSTAVLARLIGLLLKQHPQLWGVYQVASTPISKYDLLVQLRNALGWSDIAITPDTEFRCDRSLDGARFERATGWRAPDWGNMIRELAAEWPWYEQRRKEAV